MLHSLLYLFYCFSRPFHNRIRRLFVNISQHSIPNIGERSRRNKNDIEQMERKEKGSAERGKRKEKVSNSRECRESECRELCASIGGGLFGRLYIHKFSFCVIPFY